ncbi:MAG: hypothetical protein P8X74_24085 [Reinekea sp.]
MNLNEAVLSIEKNAMDPRFEKSMVDFIIRSDTQDVQKLLISFLKYDDYQVRMMGLRLVRRCIKEKHILEKIVELSFDVQRLNELQKWYSAILSRYPHGLFVDRLKSEIEKRNDPSFFERHQRALQLELADGGEKARGLLAQIAQ